MVNTYLLRVLRRWMHRLRILCTFPTLWRNFCGDCVARRWMVGNDDWDVLCMGCLTGWSRADRLALALRRDPCTNRKNATAARTWVASAINNAKKAEMDDGNGGNRTQGDRKTQRRLGLPRNPNGSLNAKKNPLHRRAAMGFPVCHPPGTPS